MNLRLPHDSHPLQVVPADTVRAAVIAIPCNGPSLARAFRALLVCLHLWVVSAALSQDLLVPGARVVVDIIMAGAPERAMWKAGTISRIENGEYVVRLDNGEERSLPIRPDKHWVSASKTSAPAPKPSSSASTPSTSVTAKGSTTTTAAAATPATKDEGDGALKPPGLGAPPSGVYNCQKIGQSYAGFGPLEIRGTTYRGIASKGAFHPFSVDSSGQIKWSAGIGGLPDGWTIRSSYYAGKDSLGRPLIKIYYRSKAGWNDLIDCVME
jgi:hypothetical protein